MGNRAAPGGPIHCFSFGARPARVYAHGSLTVTLARLEPAISHPAVKTSKSAVPLALARELEAAHLSSMLRYADSLARHCPEVGACSTPLAGGQAVFAGQSPFSSATGMAMDRAITAAELDEVARFFLSRGSDVRIEVCPLADPSLVRLLEQRGYRVAEVTSALYCHLAPATTYDTAVANAIKVRWADLADGERWAEFLTRCLYGRDAARERRRDMLAMFMVPDSLNCMGYLDGELAGIGGGMLPVKGGIATFYGGCTLPRARQRGLHAAVLYQRLRRAAEAGCRMVLAACTPGSDSERNLQRLGFAPAYYKRTYQR
jgi:hypothetical protein